MHTECKLCVHSKKSMCACSRFQHSNKSRRTAHKCTYTHASMLVWILRAEQMDWNQIRFLCIHSSFPFFFAGATLLRHTGERMNVNIWWTDDEYTNNKIRCKASNVHDPKMIFPCFPNTKSREYEENGCASVKRANVSLNTIASI